MKNGQKAMIALGMVAMMAVGAIAGAGVSSVAAYFTTKVSSDQNIKAAVNVGKLSLRMVDMTKLPAGFSSTSDSNDNSIIYNEALLPGQMFPYTYWIEKTAGTNIAADIAEVVTVRASFADGYSYSVPIKGKGDSVPFLNDGDDKYLELFKADFDNNYVIDEIDEELIRDGGNLGIVLANRDGENITYARFTGDNITYDDKPTGTLASVTHVDGNKSYIEKKFVIRRTTESLKSPTEDGDYLYSPETFYVGLKKDAPDHMQGMSISVNYDLYAVQMVGRKSGSTVTANSSNGSTNITFYEDFSGAFGTDGKSGNSLT